MAARLLFILTLLSIAGCGGGGANILPEPFTRERADGKIPVKTELIRQQVRAELAGMPEGEAEVARWQQIETDYNNCRLLSGKAKAAKEEVFADCMSDRGYVYMYPIDAEQLHNDIEFEITKERDKRIAAERKAEEERIAAERKAEEERIAAEKKRQEEQERIRRQKKLDNALVAAVRNGDTAEEARLIAEGANPQVAEKERRHIAAAKKRVEEKYRLQRQEQLDRALVQASGLYGDIKKVHILIKEGANVNIDEQELGVYQPLYYASSFGHTEIVNALIKAGANLFVRGISDMTPLHAAAEGGHTKTADTLIKAGAYVNDRDWFGRTPLHRAVWKGHAKTILSLIKHGADIDAKQKYGETPLHYAVRHGQTETLLALIKHGADIDAKDNLGWTPLHLAALENKTQVARALIKAEASLFVRTKKGNTPLDIAIRKYGKDSKIARILREAMKKRESELE